MAGQNKEPLVFFTADNICHSSKCPIFIEARDEVQARLFVTRAYKSLEPSNNRLLWLVPAKGFEETRIVELKDPEFNNCIMREGELCLIRSTLRPLMGEELKWAWKERHKYVQEIRRRKRR